MSPKSSYNLNSASRGNRLSSFNYNLATLRDCSIRIPFKLHRASLKNAVRVIFFFSGSNYPNFWEQTHSQTHEIMTKRSEICVRKKKNYFYPHEVLIVSEVVILPNIRIYSISISKESVQMDYFPSGEM